MKELLQLNPYFTRYKGTLVAGTVLLVLANFFLIFVPVLIRRTMDEVEAMGAASGITEGVWQVLTSSEAGWLLTRNTGYLIFAALMYGMLLFATRQTLIVASRKMEFDLRNDIYAHLQKLPKSYYDQNRLGDIYTRSTEDVVRVREYFGPAFMYTVNTISRTGIIIAIMLMVHPMLTFWALLPLPLLAVLAYWVSRFINRRSNEIQQQYAVMAGKLQEVYSSIRMIRSFNRESYERDQFFSESDRYRRRKLRLDLVEALFHPMLLLLIGLSVILVVWQGGIMVMQGMVSVGNIAEFVIYVNYLTWPVASLGYTLNLMQRSAASNSRIQKLLASGSAGTGPSTPHQNATPGHSSTPHAVLPRGQASITRQPSSDTLPQFDEIVFENVSFSYPGSSEPVLENISFRVKSGERVGFVGRTGSGKTSLMQLLPRLYDPDNGRILVDGVDIRTLDPVSWRALIGFVPQDTFLFSDTIAENILFGNRDAGTTEMEQAASQAGLLENVMNFEKKFDTILGERGITLSGGQKQRTGIARALIRKPRILILDDALSAVDTRTEDTIIGHLDSDFPGITMFIVCHRLSSLKCVDTIYVLEEGRIVEQGSRGELLEKQGVFADMCKKQMLEEELEHI